MRRRRRMRGATTVAAIAAVFAVSAFVPAVAFGQQNLVKDLVKGVQDSVSGLLGGGGGGGGGAGAPIQTQQGTPPDYQPPLHENGDRAHGQGTVGVVDLAPTDQRPLPANPEASTEDVIIGDSRGERDANGDYHGRITLLKANLLGVINLPAIVEVETDEGETASGPLEPLQEALLDQACTQLGQPVGCIEILRMDSATTDTGSVNDFRTAGVNLPGVLTVGVADSHGSTSHDANCQYATGSSSVANATLLGAFPVQALNSSSTSTACNDGTQTTDAQSDVVALGGQPLFPGCGNPGEPGSSVPNTTVLDLLPVLFLGCASDDTNTNQASHPYNVREALTAFLLDLPLDPLTPIKVSTANAESHATAPGGGPPQPPAPSALQPPADRDDRDRDRRDRDDRGDEGAGPGAGPAAGDAQAADEDLAFTGANLLWLALIGTMLIAGGLGLARASGRRNRRLTA